MPREYRLQEEKFLLDTNDLQIIKNVRRPVPLKITGVDIFTQRKADGKAVQLLVLTIDSPDIACIRRNCGLVGKPVSLNLHITILERKYI